MATFHIHEDAEKENPQIAGRKEKHIKPNVLQPSALALTLRGVQGRTGFPAHNKNTGNTGANARAGANKATLKVNDENAGFTAGISAAGKKSTAVPVVEQFKPFSVYVDANNEAAALPAKAALPLQPKQAQKGAKHNAVHSTTADKERIDEQRAKTSVKSASIHKDYGIADDDYALDTTPMSVSDILSPMSVDRSLSTSRMIDDSNSKSVADSDECSPAKQSKPQNALTQTPLPRNDRQRFYEVVEYQYNILEYFRESEQKHRPKPHYMRRQADINYSMRTILVDWLVEVSEEYNLDTETLYLSVSYIDRFLSHMSVVRSKLQLVGTAAMYIASKYEEIYPPDVSEFVFITDDTYTKQQVLRMEQIILKILAFDLCTPTAYVYVNTYAVMVDLPDAVKHFTLYLCELSLLEADPYLRFYPSLISSAALALARYHLLKGDIWSDEIQDMTKYRLEDLKEVLVHLSRSHNAAASLGQQAIQEKYKQTKFNGVSKIKPQQITEEQFDQIVDKYNAQRAEKDLKLNDDPSNKPNVRRMISLMFN